VTQINDYNPDGNLSKVSSVVMSASGSVAASASIVGGGCFSFSIKGTKGKVVTATFGSASSTVTLTGSWQRVSVPLTFINGSRTATVTAVTAQTVLMTRWSIESGTEVEKVYTRTVAVPYGPVSRFSSLVRVSFPSGTLSDGGTVVMRVSSDVTLSGFRSYLVKVDATAAQVDVELPKFSDITGHTITVIKILGSNTVRVKTQSPDTLEGNEYEDLTAVGDGLTIGG
jgi:hypothetical protein